MFLDKIVILLKEGIHQAMYNIEQIKLIHDHTKNMTTLSTGSIVILITFFDKIAQQPSWAFLVATSLGAFVISILGALYAQIAFIDFANNDIKNNINWYHKLGSISIIISWLAFIIAVISLCIFGIKNLPY
jgi:membrane protein YqaA with SNARE-associated domain